MAEVTDYQSFKDYLITFLWKKGDQQLIDNLDNLIRQGENMIARELRVELRHTSANLAVGNQRVTLPNDYYAIRQVVDLDGKLGTFQYVSPAELEARRDRAESSTWWPIYSLQDNQILFCGPATGGRQTVGPTPPVNPQEGDLWSRTTVAPGLYIWNIDPTSSQWVQLTSETAAEIQDTGLRNIVVHYVRRIPKYKDEDSSWLVEDYLDLLTYASLYNSAPFLREDERVGVWQGMYKDIINSANEMAAHEQQRGVYGAMPLPRNAAGATRTGMRRRLAYKLETRP